MNPAMLKLIQQEIREAKDSIQGSIDEVKDLVGSSPPSDPPTEPKGYVRPHDWLELPEVKTDDQKVVGLHLVSPDGSNFVAFKIEGDYTVDWGDGSPVESYDSGQTAEHIYDYDDLDSATYCHRGYRQAIVVIEPQEGSQLTSIDLSTRHSQDGLIPYYGAGWLDIDMAGEHIGSLIVGQHLKSLEQFSLRGSNSIANFSEMFLNCYSLQSVELDTSSGVYFNGMFNGCYSLQSVELDTSSGVSFSGMFNVCHSLRSIPELDVSSGVYFNNMFRHCYSLRSIPELDVSSGVYFSGMFNSCHSLQSVELDVSSGIDLNFMFNDCYSLKKASLQGASSSISFSSLMLSREALVEIFNGLAEVEGATVNITGNWGASQLTQADRDIALNKGWTIIG